jgi:RNA polymerase sigma-70 factor (ECF subfamily)
MSLISPEDQEFLKRCISGDKKAWDQFVDRFSALIYHGVSRTLQHAGRAFGQEDAADLMQSVFVRLHEGNYKKLRQFEGKCSLATWIRMISVRTTIDHLRRNKTHLSLQGETDAEVTLVATLHDEGSSVEQCMEEKQAQQLLAESVKHLTPRERLFVGLYYTRELPLRQVADIMNSSMGAIYTMKNRIREKLRKLVEEFL